MPGAKRVVFRLIAPQEAADAAILLDGGKLIAPPGQDLVRVGLMTDIPDQTVVRRIKSIVQRHRQLDRAERSTRVPADPSHRLQNVLPNFISQFRQFVHPQTTQVRGRVDVLEKSHAAEL